jgi:hypothetical protein
MKGGLCLAKWALQGSLPLFCAALIIILICKDQYLGQSHFCFALFERGCNQTGVRSTS